VLAPPKTEETTPAPQSLEVPKRQDGSRWSVLYIEDNPANLKLIKDLLALRPEIKLITALRGRLGLNLARRFVPDLVLLDLHLPDISGLEVLTELKAQPLTRKIPVVVLTADATPSQATTLKAAGCDDYLTKPLDMKRLLAVLGERLMRVQVSPRG
jgi:CheY-like chemotaxis protein